MVALIYLLILVAAFFILIVLPQRRQGAAHRALVASVRVGDEIMTTSGIFGTVTELDDATANLEIAPGVTIRIARGAISQRLSSPTADTPASAEPATTDQDATDADGTETD